MKPGIHYFKQCEYFSAFQYDVHLLWNQLFSVWHLFHIHFSAYANLC